MRSGCEILKCPDLSEEGRCLNQADTVNRETGEDMCPRNTDAIPRSEWEAGQAQKGEAPPLVSPPETGPAEVAQPIPEMKEYLLTVRVRLGCLDDVLARARAKEFLAEFGPIASSGLHAPDGSLVETKLQRLSKSGPPVKVEL